jgi:rod shape-determining protein MreD
VNNKYIYSGIYIFILLILQLSLVELFSIGNFKPDLVLIGLIYFTLTSGQIPGIVAAFFTGLALDILSGGVIGANSLSKVIATFVAGYFSSDDSDRFTFTSGFFAIIFLCALIDKIVYILVTLNVSFKSLVIVIVNHGIIPAVVTLVISLFVLVLPRKSEIR